MLVKESSFRQSAINTGHNGHAIRFGVMGSAAADHEVEVLERCRELGQAISRSECCLLTGACSGLPQAAASAAKSDGGQTIGISPAVSLKEHVEFYHSPYEEYDFLIFTGLGFMGRELINIRSSDIVVVVGGRSGTLGEFSIAYEEGKLIGVLSESGGITAVIPELEAHLGKETGAEVIYDGSPEHLVTRLLDRYRAEDYKCPCHPTSWEQPTSGQRRQCDCLA